MAEPGLETTVMLDMSLRHLHSFLHAMVCFALLIAASAAFTAKAGEGALTSVTPALVLEPQIASMIVLEPT